MAEHRQIGNGFRARRTSCLACAFASLAAPFSRQPNEPSRDQSNCRSPEVFMSPILSFAYRSTLRHAQCAGASRVLRWPVDRDDRHPGRPVRHRLQLSSDGFARSNHLGERRVDEWPRQWWRRRQRLDRERRLIRFRQWPAVWRVRRGTLERRARRRTLQRALGSAARLAISRTRIRIAACSKCVD